ncbi:uncharacterized protein MONBRDRAFT_27486 [Monosiga brevicollis MX1]|uniref:Peroxin-5 n=1 Tax=Monosiga brevicollis TaxID=81824 RepID=A9V5E9_MONBE|nr:uncharacterized protein MONBRDRAFT_27486 [Monosiga brevicollis MX1]EDQ87270.1 predicted protein [Monosiga brevicollis MX1]|eukprot:XP_001747883.1 hypothetical protein [Monosiga brevicollis MX1]
MAQEWARQFATELHDNPTAYDTTSTATASTSFLRSHRPYLHSASNPFIQASDAAQTRPSADELVAQGRDALQRGALIDAILLFEAATQTAADHAEAWELLGASRAENEQEELAIAALSEAVRLDPRRRSAWLALATSLTNETQFREVIEALTQVLRGSGTSAAALADQPLQDEVRLNGSEADMADWGPQPDNGSPLPHTPRAMTFHARLHALVDRYQQALAGAAAEHQADLLVGLGIMHHILRDYEAAADNFQAALAQRPDDFLLWNKLGATLANSERSEEALQIYRHALTIRPGYVRARYNAGVACLNLRLHRDAVEHFLAALALQASHDEQDAGAGPSTVNSPALNSPTQVMSDTIWSALKMALMMSGLYTEATLVNQRDVSLFRDSFDF